MASFSKGICSCVLAGFVYAQGSLCFKKMLHCLAAPFAPEGLLLIRQDEE